MSHQITERKRSRQLAGTAQKMRLHLGVHHLQGRVIAGQMMQQLYQQPAVVLLIVGCIETQPWRLTYINPETARIETLIQLPGGIARLEPNLFKKNGRLAPDYLHSLPQTFPMHRAAQNIVTRNDCLQGFDIALEPLLRIEAHLAGQKIRIPFAAHQVMKKNALLQRSQWINILHVGGAARHRRNYPVDLLLTQSHQRKHLQEMLLRFPILKWSISIRPE